MSSTIVGFWCNDKGWFMVECRLYTELMPYLTQVPYVTVSICTCGLACLCCCWWWSDYYVTFPFQHTDSQLCLWRRVSGQAECLQGGLQLYTNQGRRTWFWYAGICHQAAHWGPVHPSEEEEYNPSRAAAGEEELQQLMNAVCLSGKLQVSIPVKHWGRSISCGPCRWDEQLHFWGHSCQAYGKPLCTITYPTLVLRKNVNSKKHWLEEDFSHLPPCLQSCWSSGSREHV